ncbi:hypothetical protein WBG06_22515 [Nocardioides sp. CCNWLW239]|uniref:hypothetical protein n=1 Tax=Nocardioides sp. CCNWLW239 TaxID=3128902 RepID=UPI00301A2AA6
MTTATSKTMVLRGSAAVSGAAALAALVVAFFVAGTTGLIGALIGSVAALVILGAGTWAMFWIAGKSPALSLPGSFGVFTIQGLLLFAVLLVLSTQAEGVVVRSAALLIVVVTIAWTTSFAFLVRRERIPLFDLPGADA